MHVDVPEFITKIEHPSFTNKPCPGVELEIESLFTEPSPADLHGAAGDKALKDFTVFPEDVVHFPDKPVAVAGTPVVVGVPALVIAEFFVGAAAEAFTAFQAGLFIGSFHLFIIKKFIFNQLI